MVTWQRYASYKEYMNRKRPKTHTINSDELRVAIESRSGGYTKIWGEEGRGKQCREADLSQFSPEFLAHMKVKDKPKKPAFPADRSSKHMEG